MKKFLTIALMLFAGLSAVAQGKWSTFNREPDELIGESGGLYYKYSIDSLGSITIREGDDWKFSIESYQGNFYGYTRLRSDKEVGVVHILMGLYDLNGNLLEKVDEGIESDQNMGYHSAWINTDWLNIYGQRNKLKKMVSCMKSGGGYVRIVVKRTNMPDFDMKITPYQQ